MQYSIQFVRFRTAKLRNICRISCFPSKIRSDRGIRTNFPNQKPMCMTLQTEKEHAVGFDHAHDRIEEIHITCLVEFIFLKKTNQVGHAPLRRIKSIWKGRIEGITTNMKNRSYFVTYVVAAEVVTLSPDNKHDQSIKQIPKQHIYMIRLLMQHDQCNSVYQFFPHYFFCSLP